MPADPGRDESELLANYDARDYDPGAVTVNVVALTIRDGAARPARAARRPAAAPPSAETWI